MKFLGNLFSLNLTMFHIFFGFLVWAPFSEKNTFFPRYKTVMNLSLFLFIRITQGVVSQNTVYL